MRELRPNPATFDSSQSSRGFLFSPGILEEGYCKTTAGPGDFLQRL